MTARKTAAPATIKPGVFHGDTMGTALEVVSTIMLVLSVVRFVLSVFNILVAVLPTFSVVFLSVVVVFGDVTEESPTILLVVVPAKVELFVSVVLAFGVLRATVSFSLLTTEALTTRIKKPQNAFILQHSKWTMLPS